METRYGQLDKIAVDTQSVSQALVAMTAGTVYTGILNPHPILDSSDNWIGGKGNTNLSFTGSCFTNEVSTAALVLVNGDYYINYVTGYYKVKAGASVTPTASWKVNTLYMSSTTVSVNEKEYVVQLTQSSTGAPTGVVLKNTLGQTVTLARTSAGVYTLTASAAVFTTNKTAFFPEDWNNVVSCVVTSTTILTLTMIDDGELSGQLFKVAVYA